MLAIAGENIGTGAASFAVVFGAIERCAGTAAVTIEGVAMSGFGGAETEAD